MQQQMDKPMDEKSENMMRIAFRKRLVVDKEQEAVLKKLMQPNESRFNFNLLIHSLLWIAASAGVVYSEHWLAISIFVLVLSNQLHAFTILQHECGHRNAYHNDKVNRFVGCIMAWFIYMPYTTFKECHRRHHRNLGDPIHDPDEWNYTGGRTRWLPLRVATFVPRFIVISLTRYGSDVRKKVAVELAFNTISLVALAWACYAYGYFNEFLLIYVIPLMILALIINPLSRGYEHFPLARISEDDKESRLDIAKTTISVTHPVVSWIWANINYHVEHHVYPGVPFYNLPAVAKLMESKEYIRHRHLLQDVFVKTKSSEEKECDTEANLREVSNG